MSIHRIGLPEPILYALTPRPVPSEEIVAKRRSAEPETAGAVFTPSHPDTAVHGDEHLLTELRMLAELHAAHQASGSSSQAA